MSSDAPTDEGEVFVVFAQANGDLAFGLFANKGIRTGGEMGEGGTQIVCCRPLWPREPSKSSAPRSPLRDSNALKERDFSKTVMLRWRSTQPANSVRGGWKTRVYVKPVTCPLSLTTGTRNTRE